MRLWHPDILPYLPDLQLKGQLRELTYIYNKVRSCKSPNHLLVNFVNDYPPAELSWYFNIYREAYKMRFGYDLSKAHVHRFAETDIPEDRSNDIVPFPDHMDKGYLDVCMMNLYEKHRYAAGKSRISEDEWDRLVCGYEDITGKVFLTPYARGYFHSLNGS